VQAFKAGDVGAAGAAARRTLALGLDEAAFPRTVAQLILGITHYFAGEAPAAEAALGEAARLAGGAGNDLGRSYALGYLGLLRAAAGDGPGAERYGVEATGLSDAPGFVEHFVTMAGHLARGRAAELAGRLEEAEASLERALALAGRGAGRLERALAALALARVRQALVHAEAARALLREARQELGACPDPGRLGAQLSAAEAVAGAARRGAASSAGEGREELTERELAVLRLLGSQLSRREIADALYVSDNTVKTHVRSIFRKLDAASRDEAVERGRELALL
jgi:LuxR family transcriptional regulator, maltose regulon positive regulatory protein